MRHVGVSLTHSSNELWNILDQNRVRLKAAHLLSRQHMAGLDQCRRVSLRLLAHLQELGCLDQWLQRGHSAPCLQPATPQPLLNQTHVVPGENKKSSKTLRSKTVQSNYIQEKVCKDLLQVLIWE